MMVKATMSRAYQMRVGLVAALLLVFCLFPSPITGFLYDAVVRYPEQQRIYEEYVEVRETHEDWRSEWVQRMQAHGYPEVPEGRSEMDITTQYIFAGITGGLGLLFLFGFLRTFGRWVAVDDEGLLTSARQRARWAAITSVDQERWETKGIAVVHYRTDAGQPARITLDDWKYDREPTQAIFEHARREVARANGEQIDGDDVAAAAGGVARGAGDAPDAPPGQQAEATGGPVDRDA
ncbi:MAG: hypothetical protein WD009_14680 [Phycisphaeraceae bacterium]